MYDYFLDQNLSSSCNTLLISAERQLPIPFSFLTHNYFTGGSGYWQSSDHNKRIPERPQISWRLNSVINISLGFDVFTFLLFHLLRSFIYCLSWNVFLLLNGTDRCTFVRHVVELRIIEHLIISWIHMISFCPLPKRVNRMKQNYSKSSNRFFATGVNSLPYVKMNILAELVSILFIFLLVLFVCVVFSSVPPYCLP